MQLHIPKHYFKGDVPHGFTSLFVSKTLMFVASGLLGVFMPIFLYELFDDNFQHVMIWYLVGSFIYLILIVYGAQLLNRLGFKRSLQISALLGALYYTILFFVDKDSWRQLLPIALLVITFWRITYWLPYHVKFTQLSDKKNRGKQLSLMLATASILGVFAPLIAGIIIVKFDFNILFAVATILFVLTFIPFVTIPRVHEKFTWSYSKTWRELLKKKNQSLVVPLIANGAENVVGVLIWPIFIFNILDGNYFETGAISTFIIGVTIIVQLSTGSYIDGKGKKKTLRLGSALYSLGWFIKIFVATGFHIFAAGIYHNIVKIFTQTPFDTLVYEMAADQGHYIDEFTAIREIAINIGKVLMLIVALGISLFYSIEVTFIFAAVSSLLLNMVYINKHIVFNK